MRIYVPLLLVAAYLGSSTGPIAAIENFGQLLLDSFRNGDGRLADKIILDTIPVLFNQKPCNLNGTLEQFRSLVFADESNKDIVHASIVDIIRRSGYGVETHRIVADDGYITTLFRIINPLADGAKLKQPPVMIMHGGTIDPAAYIWASSIQHHPESYPRSPGDGPITSWNRSLAFMLSNNGYDVWLVGTRGANKENQGKEPLTGLNNVFADINNHENITLAEVLIKLRNSALYWRYSFDEMIESEIPRQLDRILEITGAKNITLFSFSYASMSSFALLGTRPDIGTNKIHNYINMAPIINLDSANTIVKMMCRILPLMPVTLGTPLITQMLDSQTVRNLITYLTRRKDLRYTLAKLVIVLALGSSAKFRTMLEPPVMGHVLQPVGFKQLQHSCQMANARQYQKFDYGPFANLLLYNQIRPPVYNISNIHVKNWMLISGENDNFGCQSSIKQILDQVNPKPIKHQIASGYNHLDLLAAFDNDVQVNLPVLEFLNRFALVPNR